MKKKYLYLLVATIIIAVVILLSFFHSSHSLRRELILADSLMNAKPDSVLAILNQIEDTKHLSKEEAALYALLMTQAQFKNYKPVESDSLIKIAYEYYMGSRDSLRKSQVYFYKGRIHENLKNAKEAINFYQKASVAAESIKDYDFLTLIYNRWGLLLCKQN